MTFYLREYRGYGSGRPFPYLSEPAIATTLYSTGVAGSTATLSAGTQLVEMYATANVWVLFSASSASTTVATTTNATLIVPSGPPIVRAVTAGSRYTVLST